MKRQSTYSHYGGCQDTEDNHIQHNDTGDDDMQHNGTQHDDIQYNRHQNKLNSVATVVILVVALFQCYADYRNDENL